VVQVLILAVFRELRPECAAAELGISRRSRSGRNSANNRQSTKKHYDGLHGHYPSIKVAFIAVLFMPFAFVHGMIGIYINQTDKGMGLHRLVTTDEQRVSECEYMN